MIKIAIIGAGFMGRTHAQIYVKAQNAKVVGLCDKNRELGETFAEEFQCAYFDEIEDLLKQCDVDVMDICVPTFLHEEYVMTAAKHKKYVFCEKPVTFSVRQLDGMIRAVEQSGKRMFEGQVVRFWPEYVTAKRKYESGELGDLKAVYAARLSEHPAWSEWYRKVENSGGGLLDLHLHDVDYICHLLGKAEYVYAVGQKNEYGCWNHVMSVLSFPSGISASVEGIIEMAKGYPFTMQLRLVGEKKVYDYIMKAGSNLEDVGSARRETRVYEDGNTTVLPLDETDAYETELLHFLSCVEQDKESEIICMEDVRNVLCTIEAIRTSLETGAKVKVSYA